MSFPHHEDQRENSRLLELFRQQQEGIAQRQWPEGRIAGSDDGELAFRIGVNPEKELIAIEFPKEIKYVAMSPRDAISLAQSLIKHARSISKEPLRINLH